MSFFKDFKEDLTQAVNELIPEENKQAAPQQEAVSDSSFNSDELADMLKNIEDVQTEVKAEAAPVIEPVPVVEAAPVVEPVPAPVVEPAPTLVAEPAPAPVAQPASTVAPVFAPEPVIPEEQKLTVAPIFGEPDVIKEEPINTVKNLKAMETGVIIKGMNVKGDITSEGSLDVKGAVNGNITVEGRLEVTGEITGNSSAEEVFADGAKVVGDIKCNGAVKVGPSSVVRGNITATAAVIAGAVKGDIDVQGPVILDSTAIIMGNIKSKSIQINNGATIEGLCSQCYGDISPMSFFGEEKPEKPATKSTKASK